MAACVLWLTAVGLAEKYCWNDTYFVTREVIYLDPAEFTEERLRAALAGYDHDGHDREAYVLVLSGKGGAPSLGPPRGDDVRPVITEGPVALLFQFDGNTFFQFRDAGGTIRWVQIRGENPFLEIRRRHGLELVGLNFAIRSLYPSCDRLLRWVGFGATDPSWSGDLAAKAGALIDMAHRLKGLGDPSESFTVRVYPSIETAGAFFPATFATPLSMRFYLTEPDPQERKRLLRVLGQGDCDMTWRPSEIRGRWRCTKESRLWFELNLNLREEPWEEWRIRELPPP